MDEKLIAKTIWEGMACLSDDYSSVEFDMIMRRPRYAHLRDIIFRAARQVIAVSAPTHRS